MTPLDEAVARARTFGWIAEVLLDGWTERAVAVARDLPWLQLPESSDARAVRYQRVFGQVPPYESVFLEPTGQLGGSVSSAVRDAYGRCGFASQRTDVEPDHVGLQCALLSFLYGAEADALRDGLAAGRIVDLRTDFVTSHLARWASALAVAAASHGVEEIDGLLALIVELTGGERALPGVAETPLDDDATRLRDVCRYLAVPARCGAWLSVLDIQRIARDAELACGFGPRVKMLESLWFGAVDHQRVPELVASFEGHLERWHPLGGTALIGCRETIARLGRAVVEESPA